MQTCAVVHVSIENVPEGDTHNRLPLDTDRPPQQTWNQGLPMLHLWYSDRHPVTPMAPNLMQRPAMKTVHPECVPARIHSTSNNNNI
jgi:hypothetical protein